MGLEKFFNPQSIAVIGASGDKSKVGYSLVANLLAGGKRKIYPVTLKEKEILGIPAFANIIDVPDGIELAIIAVRADIVPDVLSNCGKKDIKNAIIISSGFKEAGPSGAELENRISMIAKEYGILLLGPNCLGVIDGENDFNASFAVRKPLPGKIAFLSQSGALGTAMIDWATDEGIGLSKFISLGNEAQLTEVDFLEFLENDPRTHAILMYLENISSGQKFIETLSRIAVKKPVVIIKAGMGSHGNLAVMSHTGTLAPQSSVFLSACKQAGAVTVSSLRGFFHIIKILSQTVDINTPIQRLIILTNGGGPSVVAADLVDRSCSLSLTELSNDTKEALREVLPPMAAVGNPVDIIGDALAERYEKALDILSKVENADAIVVILTPQMMTEAEATAKVLAKYNSKKKIFPIFIGGQSVKSGRAELIKSGLTFFSFPKDVMDGLDYLARSAPKLKSQLHDKKGETNASRKEKSAIGLVDVINLLSKYGISLSGKFIWRKEELEETLNNCGQGPYVMKAISKDIIHKTDVGAVRLGVNTLEEASTVWEEMWKLGQLEGILIQKMEKPVCAGEGREVIIGMKRDNTFGPTILFGLGGILAEAIKDTTLRITPVSKEEALKMMKEIRGAEILNGLRGQPPVNFDALADIIVNLSRLALEHPEIKEIDLNPIICSGDSATIVDARIMI